MLCPTGRSTFPSHTTAPPAESGPLGQGRLVEQKDPQVPSDKKDPYVAVPSQPQQDANGKPWNRGAVFLWQGPRFTACPLPADQHTAVTVSGEQTAWLRRDLLNKGAGTSPGSRNIQTITARTSGKIAMYLFSRCRLHPGGA